MPSLPLSGSSRGEYQSVSQGEDAPVELQGVGIAPEASKPRFSRPHARTRSGGRSVSSISIADTTAVDPKEVSSELKWSPTESSRSSFDGDEPTEEEKLTLRKVPDKLPWSASLIAVVELCERFAYYGLSGPFQNYMANSYHDPSGLPGAIGLNQHGATLLSSFFQFWCYLTPIAGAIVADQYLGKYLTIVYFAVIYMVGILILFFTSLPVSIKTGWALPGLFTAMIVIGIGTGGIKSNVSPLIAEQYRETKPRLKILPSGERVIIDPSLTIERVYMIFYMAINIGSLGAILTTTMEFKVGFWAAYLLPLCAFIVGFTMIVLGKNRIVSRPPSGSVIGDSFKALWIAILHKGNLDAAKPMYHTHRDLVPWDDTFIEELKRTLMACKVFCFYPVYWAAFNQMSNNFVSQAGQMELHGIPNDIMPNLDAIIVIIFIPIMDKYIYPRLRKLGFPMKPITRITCGFVFGAMGMAYAAYLQHRIYSNGPCYYEPSHCPAGLRPDGSYEPNHVHVAFQIPAYLVLAISEIFASVTGLEYAFTKAPTSMKSFIMSLFLLTNAFGAMLGMLISPFARDPELVWMYSGLAIGCVVAASVFWKLFSKYNAAEDSMNELNGGGKEMALLERSVVDSPA